MKVKDMMREIRNRISPLYGDGEARAIGRLIFHNLKGWNATDLIIHEADELSDYMQQKIERILERISLNEPIQYILGEAYFYGMDLEVNPSVLIPRPETEELVDMIVKRWDSRQDLRVLDIGTGSGAIAIALSRNLPFAKVEAIDISEAALEVAKRNAAKMKAKIAFRHEDVFAFSPAPESFDIIVSNPPYIDENEKSGMEANVLDYEPHTALFVPDATPLIFYSRIAGIAAEALTEGGALYFEINPRHCNELKTMLSAEGFKEIEEHKDIHGRDRFISAFRK